MGGGAVDPAVNRLVLAAIGPVVLSGATVAAYVAPRAPNPSPEVTERAEHRLWRGAEILVVGNSTAFAAIVDRPLGQRLGRRSAHLTMLDTTIASWYAALRYRVFGTGERPEVVVLAGPEFAFTALAPAGTHDLAYVVDIAGSDDPEVLARLAPTWPEAVWLRARARRDEWQRAVFAGASRGVASWFGVGEEARARHLFFDLNGPPPVGLDDGGEERPVADTFLPAIVDLVQAHGSQLVVVRTPMRHEAGQPFVSSTRNDRIRAYLTERGVPYYDQIAFDGLQPKHFMDGFHLHDNASQGFTRDLAEQIAAALEREPVRRRRR